MVVFMFMFILVALFMLIAHCSLLIAHDAVTVPIATTPITHRPSSCTFVLSLWSGISTGPALRRSLTIETLISIRIFHATAFTLRLSHMEQSRAE